MPIVIKKQNDEAPTSEWSSDFDFTLPSLPESLPSQPEEDKSVQTYEAKFDVFTRPSVKIVQIPLFSTTSTIYDSLPIFPEVNIVPLKGYNNKIRILFNSGVGEYKLNPIVIQPEDGIFFGSIREALEIGDNMPLPFRSDDPPAFFEIFRITEHPEKYTDFAGQLISTVSTRVEEGGAFLSSTTFIDEIEPNIKYYYTFRTVDIHGNISNPSPIYKIEIADDNGAIYLLLENVELKKREETQLSKKMKKLFNVVPRMIQSIVDGNSIEDYSSANGLGVPKLGFEAEGLWGKKFKIRLTSKKTGKKMDLNINFKTEELPQQIK